MLFKTWLLSLYDPSQQPDSESPSTLCFCVSSSSEKQILWVWRASDCSAHLTEKLQSKDCPVKEPHFGQKWSGPHSAALLGNRLGNSAQAECGTTPRLLLTADRQGLAIRVARGSTYGHRSFRLSEQVPTFSDSPLHLPDSQLHSSVDPWPSWSICLIWPPPWWGS